MISIHIVNLEGFMLEDNKNAARGYQRIESNYFACVFSRLVLFFFVNFCCAALLPLRFSANFAYFYSFHFILFARPLVVISNFLTLCKLL